MKPEALKQLLQKYGLSPNKVLGQNFLTDENAVSQLVESANISKDDAVIEVGPGTGVITKELAKYAGRVLAVEKDPKMVELLRSEFKNEKNVTIIEGDILTFDIKNLNLLENSGYKLVGNPPYYLTARLFRCFLEKKDIPPSSISLIIQKEVAQKISSKPPRMNLLAVSVQLYGEAKTVKKISRGCFWPQPDVDSAILTVSNIKKPAVNEKEFFRIVRAGFSSPRKQLVRNLSTQSGMSKEETEKWLLASGIDPKRRAETLTIEEWAKLTNNR